MSFLTISMKTQMRNCLDRLVATAYELGSVECMDDPLCDNWYSRDKDGKCKPEVVIDEFIDLFSDVFTTCDESVRPEFVQGMMEFRAHLADILPS